MKLNILLEKFREALVEGLSPVLFHYTSPEALRSILRKNEFRLSPDIGSDDEISHRKGGKDDRSGRYYYMSTARHKIGGFSKDRKAGVMLVLDGVKLGYNYAGRPIDYVGQSIGYESSEDKPFSAGSRERSEAEDRVYSRESTIPKASKYIREIHILYGDTATNNDKRSIRVAYQMATKKYDIPVYFYKNVRDFQLLNKVASIPFEGAELRTPTELRTQEDRIRAKKKANNTIVFAAWLELYNSIGQPLSSLSREASEQLSFLKMNDFNEISNLKNAIRRDRNNSLIAKIIRIMRQNGFGTVEEFAEHIKNSY